MQGSDILVIVPSYGQFNFVRRTILSLGDSMDAQSRAPDFIIIDDASVDWDTIDWSCFPTQTLQAVHFEERAGLTRSWNYGLIVAQKKGYKYAICANSDLIFSHGSIERMISAIDSGISLVGPLTNAPGYHRWQDVRPFLAGGSLRAIDDSPESITFISRELAACSIGPIHCTLNGFCLAARTETWWFGAYDHAAVFNPAFPLERNEVELQERWYRLGLTNAMVPQSYVFHYRSVSRPAGLTGRVANGAFRPNSLYADKLR